MHNEGIGARALFRSALPNSAFAAASCAIWLLRGLNADRPQQIGFVFARVEHSKPNE